MPAIYVLDVPEFRALTQGSKEPGRHRVTNLGNGYYRVEADDELVFNRKELGFKPAVWYGAFTAVPHTTTTSSGGKGGGGGSSSSAS